MRRSQEPGAKSHEPSERGHVSDSVLPPRPLRLCGSPTPDLNPNPNHENRRGAEDAESGPARGRRSSAPGLPHRHHEKGPAGSEADPEAHYDGFVPAPGSRIAGCDAPGCALKALYTDGIDHLCGDCYRARRRTKDGPSPTPAHPSLQTPVATTPERRHRRPRRDASRIAKAALGARRPRAATRGPCAWPGCDRKAQTKGLCTRDDQRLHAMELRGAWEAGGIPAGNLPARWVEHQEEQGGRTRRASRAPARRPNLPEDDTGQNCHVVVDLDARRHVPALPQATITSVSPRSDGVYVLLRTDLEHAALLQDLVFRGVHLRLVAP